MAMRILPNSVSGLFLMSFPLFWLACSGGAQAEEQGCMLVESGFGAKGAVPLRTEKIAEGLEVPWAIGFLPGGDFLVTERPGRVRLVSGGQLIPQPVLEVEVGESGEGGLLGLAVHPQFAANRFFYIYYTASNATNRLERYQLSEDRRRATLDRVILDGIPAGVFHDGGRVLFGPDGMLYVGTGDARRPELAQNPSSLAGKILRLTDEGAVPGDNPIPGSPAYLTGVRNTQGFAWISPSLMVVTDHGPSGEMGRVGHDELNFARAGENLGWPESWRCDARDGMLTPALVWVEALPPGGAVLYTGASIPEWTGSILIASLGSQHLQRVVLGPGETPSILGHEVYLSEAESFGRLREVVQAPDGSLYVTTSNCDGRGQCPPEGDAILRLTRR